MNKASVEWREHQEALLGVLAFTPDDDEVAEWKSLNEILVELYKWRPVDPIEIDSAGEIEQAVEALEDAFAKGLIEKYEKASVRDTPMRITKAGNQYLDNEANIRPGDYVIHGRGSSVSSIDSAAWTGLAKRKIDNRNAETICRMIDKALSSLPEPGKSNVEIMQAAAYLKAAKELASAPEPPSDLIWRIIGQAADVVGLLAVFITIFQAF